MHSDTNEAGVATTGTPSRRDRGVTFIEVLVAIVLLGTVVIGTLAAVRATIIGTKIERDHSKAHEWLQSASEFVTSPDNLTYLDCDLGTWTDPGADIRVAYETALRNESSSSGSNLKPEDWNESQISLPNNVLFAGPSGAYAATCVPEIDRQLITIRVTDTEGKVVEEVEIIKAAP